MLNIKKNILRQLIFASIIILMPVSSSAQDISFEASVNTNKIALGSSLQLTLTITGTKDAHVELPDIAGADSSYIGPSTRVSVVNGKYSSSVAHNYSIIPLKEGNLKIPSISVTVKGKTYTTNSIDIKVVDKGALAGTGVKQNQSGSISLKDKTFLQLEIQKKKNYINEKVPFVIKLFFKDVSLKDVQFPTFEHTSMLVDKFQKPKQYQEIVGNSQYQVVEFKSFIYPTRAGKLIMGPATLKTNILIQRSGRRRNRFRGLDSFFNDDFFQGVFGGYQKHPVSIESGNFEIEVLELPRKGKPADFSGAVGQFNFEVTADPLNVKVGDPITLKMKVHGRGNTASIKMPSLEAGKDFKLYDPQIKEKGGVVFLEQVLIPKHEQATEIPDVSFTYFDVERESYKTITRGPFPLIVNKSDEESKFLEFSDKKNKRATEILGRDIVFIKDNSGSFKAINHYLYRSSGFIFTVSVSFLIWCSGLIAHKRTHKLKTDISYARRLRAPKEAKKGLSQSHKLLMQKKQKEFYNAIFKTIQDYFGNKFHLNSVSVTFDMVKEKLAEKNIHAAILSDLKSIFDECDMVRFASINLDENKMKSAYKKTQEIIDFIERHFK